MSDRSPRLSWVVAVLGTALVASACVTPGPGIPGGGGGPDPTSTTTPDPAAGCARGTSLPQPGDLAVDLVLTGKVVQQDGEPVRDGGGHAVIVDRRSSVGAIIGEAGVNDAGFFLIVAGTHAVPADLGCRDYRLEVCAPGGCGAGGGVATLTATRDVTELVDEAAGQGRQRVDISDDPLTYEAVG